VGLRAGLDVFEGKKEKEAKKERGRKRKGKNNINVSVMNPNFICGDIDVCCDTDLIRATE
jgi:hypothetical protein